MYCDSLKNAWFNNHSSIERLSGNLVIIIANIFRFKLYRGDIKLVLVGLPVGYTIVHFDCKKIRTNY